MYLVQLHKSNGLFPRSNIFNGNISQAILLTENPEGLTDFHFSEFKACGYVLRKASLYHYHLQHRERDRQRGRDVCVCICLFLNHYRQETWLLRASLTAQFGKDPPAMQETPV